MNDTNTMNDTDINTTNTKWWNRDVATTLFSQCLVLGVLNVMVMLGLWAILLEIVPNINRLVAKGYSLESVTGMTVLVNWVLCVLGLLVIQVVAHLLARFKIV